MVAVVFRQNVLGMEEIMKKFMAILLCITLVMPFASSTNVEAVSKTYTFTDDFFPTTNLEYTGKDKEIIVVSNGTKHIIPCDFVVIIMLLFGLQIKTRIFIIYLLLIIMNLYIILTMENCFI